MTNLKFKKQVIYFTAVLFLAFGSCKKEKAEKEEVPETITKVKLTFTNDNKAAAVVIAEDPDGNGVQPWKAAPIKLSPGKKYDLSISLYNGLLKASDPGYDLTDEIRKKGDEHQFFFKWTNGLFADPAGDGNMDNRNDPVNYVDKDQTGAPIGLKTKWTTKNEPSSGGTWQIVLKHQPDLKGSNSSSKDGETDLDITFPITVE